MTKNPFLNAFLALLYIVAVVLVINYGATHVSDTQPKIVGPIAMLSLFTLSAAVMGYLFVLQPLRLYLDGAKEAGVRLFLQTMGVFAVFTTAILAVLFLGLF